MSPKSSAFASTRIAFESGWGSEAAGADASRLSEKDSDTNCAWGVPSFAWNCAFFAMSCTCPPTLRSTARRAPPIWLPYRPR